jgi:hypothetical protein
VTAGALAKRCTTVKDDTEPVPEYLDLLLPQDSQRGTGAISLGFEVMAIDRQNSGIESDFGLLLPAHGATNPIAWRTAVVSYRQDEYTFIVG